MKARLTHNMGTLTIAYMLHIQLLLYSKGYTSPPRYVQVFQAFDARLLDVISVSGRRPWCLKETGSRIEASWRLECGMNSGTMILHDFTMPKTAQVEGILWGIVQAHQRLA